jgi:TPR repeat protein
LSPSRRCPYCQQAFQPSPYRLQQRACSQAECQRRRRADYHRQKIRTDPLYAQVVRDSRRQWQADHAAYQESWLRRAADQGSIPAAARLGTMAVMEKVGLAPGTDCTRWLRVAADAADSPSMLNLGMVLFHGKGVQPDFLGAYMWFTLASQRGQIDGRGPLRSRMTTAQIEEAEKQALDWNAKHSR